MDGAVLTSGAAGMDGTALSGGGYVPTFSDELQRLYDELDTANQDLEVAARIGQSLLEARTRLAEENGALQERVADLEAEAAALQAMTNDRDRQLAELRRAGRQLRHELHNAAAAHEAAIGRAAEQRRADVAKLQVRIQALEGEREALYASLADAHAARKAAVARLEAVSAQAARTRRLLGQEQVSWQRHSDTSRQPLGPPGKLRARDAATAGHPDSAGGAQRGAAGSASLVDANAVTAGSRSAPSPVRGAASPLTRGRVDGSGAGSAPSTPDQGTHVREVEARNAGLEAEVAALTRQLGALRADLEEARALHAAASALPTQRVHSHAHDRAGSSGQPLDSDGEGSTSDDEPVPGGGLVLLPRASAGVPGAAADAADETTAAAFTDADARPDAVAGADARASGGATSAASGDSGPRLRVSAGGCAAGIGPTGGRAASGCGDSNTSGVTRHATDFSEGTNGTTKAAGAAAPAGAVGGRRLTEEPNGNIGSGQVSDGASVNGFSDDESDGGSWTSGYASGGGSGDEGRPVVVNPAAQRTLFTPGVAVCFVCGLEMPEAEALTHTCATRRARGAWSARRHSSGAPASAADGTTGHEHGARGSSGKKRGPGRLRRGLRGLVSRAKSMSRAPIHLMRRGNSSPGLVATPSAPATGDGGVSCMSGPVGGSNEVAVGNNTANTALERANAAVAAGDGGQDGAGGTAHQVSNVHTGAGAGGQAADPPKPEAGDGAGNNTTAAGAYEVATDAAGGACLEGHMSGAHDAVVTLAQVHTQVPAGQVLGVLPNDASPQRPTPTSTPTAATAPDDAHVGDARGSSGDTQAGAASAGSVQEVGLHVAGAASAPSASPRPPMLGSGPSRQSGASVASGASRGSGRSGRSRYEEAPARSPMEIHFSLTCAAIKTKMRLEQPAVSAGIEEDPFLEPSTLYKLFKSQCVPFHQLHNWVAAQHAMACARQAIGPDTPASEVAAVLQSLKLRTEKRRNGGRARASVGRRFLAALKAKMTTAS